MTELVELMMPTGLGIDDDETMRASVGLVETTEQETFTGGYAESDEQAERRSKPKVKAERASKLERGLRDAIITMPLTDHEEFVSVVVRLRRRCGYTSTAETVLAALHELEAAV